MEKVLLAVDGNRPSRRVLDYSLELCKRIRAGLDILHVVKDSRYVEIFEKQRDRVKRLGKYLEAAQVAVAFAEADEQDTARQVISRAIDEMNGFARRSADNGILCELSYRKGASENEIPRFVEEHPEVILTIFDSPEQNDSAVTRRFEKIRQTLSVPVVKIDRSPVP